MITEDKLQALESEMLKHDQVDASVSHSFGPGTYIREVRLKAGSYVCGHHQNFPHTNVILEGHFTMINEDGSKTDYKAGQVFTFRAGRKVGYVHVDMRWLNIYPNVDNEQDIEKIESKWITKSEGFLLAQAQKDVLQIEQKKSTELTTTIYAPLPYGEYKFKLSKDKNGIFAVGEFLYGEVIGPVTVNKDKTVLGTYLKHSSKPNAKVVLGDDRDLHLIAIDKIFGCRGGFDGDEITIDHIDAAKFIQHRGESLCRQ